MKKSELKNIIRHILVEVKADYEIYHKSYTSAIDTGLESIIKRGYTSDAEDQADIIGLGPSKPSVGKTNKLTLPIYKKGKLQKKAAQFQIYNTGNSYELNLYIQ